MSKSIKFSVIIPTYNNADGIKKCILGALNINYSNFEIIVINDGSTDNTNDILEKLKSEKLRIISTRNRGVSAARNQGLEAATGDYIIFLDDDDELRKDSLGILNKRIQELNYPDILRYGGYRELSDGEKHNIKNFCSNQEKGTVGARDAIRLIVSAKEGINCYVWLLAVKNRNVSKFNTKLRYLEDEDFYIESLLANDSISFVNDKLYLYKFNKNSKTKNPEKFRTNIDDIVLARNVISKKLGKKEQKLYDSKIVHLVYRRLCYYMSLYETKQEKRIATKYAKEAICSNNIRSGLAGGLRSIVERLLITEPTGVILTAWRIKRK